MRKGLAEVAERVFIKNQESEIIALIDSDNILPSRDWLSRMKNFEKVLSKEGDIKYPLYVIKGRNPL
ncbi:MAG: hypothetical protein KKG76_07900 [Euryarchaeota archaeon]|nr:hypothetical protein [Euryarchaeota archaeon]